MNIKIKGYLTFKSLIGEQFLHLDDQKKVTLRELLADLSNQYELGDSLYQTRAGTVNAGTVVLVNGRHHSHLPDRLDTILQDGDEVSIFPPLVGG